MPYDPCYTFSFGQDYRALRELLFGVAERQAVPSDTEFEFREVQSL